MRPGAGGAGLKTVLAILLGALMVVGLIGQAVAQTEVEPNLEPRVVAVDATGGQIELSLFGQDLPQNESDLQLSENSEQVTISDVASSSELRRRSEVVFVVDTNAPRSWGDLVDETQVRLADVAGEINQNTTIGIVSAGSNAVVLSPRLSDGPGTAAAVGKLRRADDSAQYSAIAKASTLFSDDNDVIKSVVVISAGPDTSSSTTSDAAGARLSQQGAQLVVVDIGNGADSGLSGLISRSGGVALTAEKADYEAVLSNAVGLAANRTIVTFAGSVEPGTRADLTVDFGERNQELSYPVGAFTANQLQLEARDMSTGTNLNVFRSSIGLYLALALAFVGISAGVWALASILTTEEHDLESLLDRYTSLDKDGGESLPEDMLVQSALLRRAVSAGENLAQGRGLLIRLEALLEKADLPIRAGEGLFVLIATVLLSGALGVALTRNLLFGILIAFGIAGLALWIVRFKAGRRFKTFEGQLPDTLQLLSGTLRAGYSLPQGLESVSGEIADPMGAELSRAMSEARLGRELEEALSGIAERMQSDDFAWVVLAIGIQREVGGNLNELLLSVAETMVARERLKRDINALTAEGRVSAGLLSFLPPGLGMVMWVINPGYINVLFTETMGNVMLVAGIISALAGLAWMKKVITIDV